MAVGAYPHPLFSRGPVLSRGAATDCSHGRSPWDWVLFWKSPGGAKESQESVAPPALIVAFFKNPGRRPGLRSFAAPRL